MKKIFKIIIIDITIILMILSINLYSLGANKLITEEELENYLKKFVGENCEVVLKDNKFEITDTENNKTYNLYYDLENYEFYTEETFNKNDDAKVVDERMKMLLEIPDDCFKAVADASEIEQDLYDSYINEYGLGSLYSDWHFTYLLMKANAEQKDEDFYVKDLISGDEGIGQEDFDCFSISIEKVEESDTITLKFKLKLNSNLDFSSLNPNIDNYDYYFILKVGETLDVPWFSGNWVIQRPYDESLNFTFDDNYMHINGTKVVKSDISIINRDTAEFDIENGYTYPDLYTALVRVVSDDYDGVTGIIKSVDNLKEDKEDEKHDNTKDNNEILSDNTLAPNKLPSTGKKLIVSASLVILILICIVKYFKYKKY